MGEEPEGFPSRFPGGHIHKHNHILVILCLHRARHLYILHLPLISLQLPGAVGVSVVDLGPEAQSGSVRVCLKC